jgi:dolichyl-phosphate beta-glucosyltransferase
VQVQPRLSVVIPAYNEEERLPRTLRTVDAYLEAERLDSEIVVVDDGSRDRTAQIAREFVPAAGRIRVICNERNLGKGASSARGVKAAAGDLILLTDADLSTPIHEVSRLKAAIGEEYGIAVGSRALPDSRIVNPQPLYRRFMGRFFNGLVRLVAVPGIRDTQCGFKLFTREAALAIFGELTIFGFGFDVEILYLARKKGIRIVEVPVEWHNAPGSKVSPLQDSVRMCLDLVRIRLRHP